MYIDCHVHCRDEEWRDKETIKHALAVADGCGLDGIFDMPNVPDPVINRERVLDRFGLAKDANSPVFFGVYVGLTSDPEQIREAVDCYNEFFPRDKTSRWGVVGLKMFAGESVGDLAIIEPEEQREVYNQLAKLGHKGVLAVHCEYERLITRDLWDPLRPVTHCYARPEEAETRSIDDNIRFAKETDYQGILHIAHITTSRSVDLVQQAKRKMNGRVTCGATPHHLLLDYTVMNRANGILWKMNPPLRSPKTRAELFEDFKNGRIGILESDHAHHTLDDKLKRYMSGVPNLASWLDFIKMLIDRGVSPGLLDKVAFYNVNTIFGTQIQRTDRKVGTHHLEEYAFDPYTPIKTVQDI